MVISIMVISVMMISMTMLGSMNARYYDTDPSDEHSDDKYYEDTVDRNTSSGDPTGGPGEKTLSLCAPPSVPCRDLLG